MRTSRVPDSIFPITVPRLSNPVWFVSRSTKKISPRCHWIRDSVKGSQLSRNGLNTGCKHICAVILREACVQWLVAHDVDYHVKISGKTRVEIGVGAAKLRCGL